MANQKERQRFSWAGTGVILVLAAVTYFLVSSGSLLGLYSLFSSSPPPPWLVSLQSKSLLVLYTLATGLLVGLLVAVGFDLGVGKSNKTPILEEPEVAETPALEQAPKVRKRKRRR